MKVVITLLLVLAVSLLAFKAMTYYQRFGSIDGVAFLESDEGRARPIPGLRIFLVRETVVPKVDSLLQWYTRTTAMLEQKVEREKATLDAMKLMLDEEGKRLGAARETDPEFRKSRQQYFDRYNRYMEDKGPLDVLKSKYNQSLKDLIEAMHSRQMVSNEQGRFQFSRIKAGYWYLYAFYGNFLGNIAWFERVEVRGPTQVMLSRKNATTLLK